LFHKQTLSRLFDHLVGGREQRCRDRQAKRFSSLEIDDQFEFCWLLDGKIGRTRGLAPRRILSTRQGQRRDHRAPRRTIASRRFIVFLRPDEGDTLPHRCCREDVVHHSKNGPLRSEVGQSRHFEWPSATSAIHPTADIHLCRAK
jgi:hypothetical protein